ncbi:N-formylglutamate amidohydrolase [Ideonella sp. BN130291]|uniref:N-formylglutamate amidohydrolase n=1 Tax=Ideonella sp. BN130291 TaxID=3112940 RepID=UPI002E25674A|nr:N-formylglutamate amidohydrolase [Ideonella sp. BN130291]
MPTHPPDAYLLHRPAGDALPIVVDSPHSGRETPADFDTALAPGLLRSAEDSFVDELWAGAPRHGAVLLAARFPRAYIDPNRALADIDEALLDGAWPGEVRPGPKTRLGIGLVWRLLDGQPMYRRRLSVAEVQRRIDTCWRPYTEALQRELEAAHQRFGARWHLNVHSMPDDSYRKLGLGDRPLADFVLGDRDASTADEATMALIEASLRSSGFSVARNDPFKGVEIVRTSGDPSRHCHAVQIEVKKSLYMDAAAYQRNAGFARVQRAIERLLGDLANHVRQQISKA